MLTGRYLPNIIGKTVQPAWNRADDPQSPPASLRLDTLFHDCQYQSPAIMEAGIRSLRRALKWVIQDGLLAMPAESRANRPDAISDHKDAARATPSPCSP